MKNIIGLNTTKTKELADNLNELLANYSIFYQNVRGYHWNIKGPKFFELHVKFEELYSNLLIKIDEIAERIRTLDYSPNHNYSDYQQASTIIESPKVSDPVLAIEGILNAFKITLSLQRKLLMLSEDAEDEGTHTLVGDYIRDQEKLVWMYSAFLQK